MYKEGDDNMNKSSNKNIKIDKKETLKTTNQKENELLQYFTEEELQIIAKELAYINEHPKEYKAYNNIHDLKKDLLNN